MVRETRHLWVGNLPDNIREDRIREHFKRYGRVQSIKLLPRSVKEETGENTTACTVAFMDIKSASKAHTAEHKIDERTLTTEYYEPAAIPSAASPQNTNSTYSTSPGSTRFPPNTHGTPDEHGNFNERFYDRNNSRVAEGEYIRRVNYHDNRGRNRDRGYRNGPYNNVIDRHRPINAAWTYDASRTYNAETGYGTTPTDTSNDRRSSDSQSTKKKTKSQSGSRSVSPSGSNSSTSPTRSRSQSSSSSSSSTTSQASSSTGSPKSRRIAASANASHQPVVHSDDRRPLAICVRNLPLRSSDTSLKDGLFHEYKKHGKVTWVKIVGQGSERHAIVCFKKPEDVDKALEVSYDKLFFGCKIEVASYQGYDVDDNELRPYEAEIDEFHPKATRTLFIGNLEKDVTASDLRKHFDQFGEIIEIDIKKQGAVSSYAFCQYSDIISVVKAIRAMDGEHLGNNRIKLGFGKSMPTDCVWVDGVVDSVNEKYLTLQFDSFGPITQVIIDRDKGQGLIFYEQVVNAQAAVLKMRGVNMRGRKMQVDFASRECQEAFYEHLEKQGHPADRTTFDERNPATRTFEAAAVPATPRFARYETPSTRPRTASYSSRSSVGASQCNTTSTAHSPSTPGSATPRGSGSRSRLARFNEFYDPNTEFTERRYRSYDEYSQGSAASHEEGYEHEYAAYNRDSPSHVETGEARIPPHTNDHLAITFAPPDIRNLQKERFHLLEQLEDYTSSGDEVACSKKRLRLDLIEGPVASDVIIEANRDHRKVMEVRRTSDTSLKHHSRRPSVDNKHNVRDNNSAYLPHTVCKRRKTAGSDSSSRLHHEFSGSESIGSSRPGTPLCDERPENFPTEPRRIPREREGPLSLPLPRFAAQLMGKGSVSVAGIKGQKDNVLASPPPAATSPRISNHVVPSLAHVPPPASPPPRPPSLSSNSSDSDATPPSPSLDERIKSLDEKYEKWSGSRAVSAAGSEALAKLDATASERFRFSYKLLDLDLKELQPSDIVKSVLAKPSVFDEDSKRLENVGGKFDFGIFTKAPPTPTAVIPSAAPLSAPPVLKTVTTTNTPLPKTPTMLSPRSSGSNIATAKSLQYPFPSHPPLQAVGTPTTPTLSPLPTQPSPTVTPRSNPLDNRQKPNTPTTSSSDTKISTKVINRTGTNSAQVKLNDPHKIGVSIPVNSSDAVQSTNLNSVDANTKLKSVRDKNSDKINRRDSTSSIGSPRNEIKNRRNSENSGRKIELCDKKSDNCDTNMNQKKIEEKEKSVDCNERIDSERLEIHRIEKVRLEKESENEERVQKEKQRLEREEKDKKEREEQEKVEKERKEKEEKERREREERERRERDEKERREKEEKERRDREEREKLEREKHEREEREKHEREEKDKREREEREKRDKEEREKRERDETIKREREEQERVEKERKREENHEKRKEEHNRHRETHSESKHKENFDSNRIDKKESKSRDSHDLFRNNHDSKISHEARDRFNDLKKEEKSKHYDRDDKRKENSKENRENNLHEKLANIANEIKENNKPTIESRHFSIDLERTKTDPNRRKERNNSLPASVGSKRRLSCQESVEMSSEIKRMKMSQEHRKLSERRESKDSKLDDKTKNKHKNNIAKIIEDKMRQEKVNNVKEGSDERRKDRDRDKDDKHRHKQKLEKQKSKERSKEKESVDSKPPVRDLTMDKEFLARLDLQSTEDSEKMQRQRKEAKEKRKQEILENEERKSIDFKKSDEKKKEKRPSVELKSRDENSQSTKVDERKFAKKERIRKSTHNSSDAATDSDEPKKQSHSIFDIVDDEPAYISMYDKVKARSCKNMQKQEEEKRQEKLKAKFNQLKQSRAKREEKKRSTSCDEDSDSDHERHERSSNKSDTGKSSRRGTKMLIMSSDEDEHGIRNKPRKKRDIYSKSSDMESSDDESPFGVFKRRKYWKYRVESETSEDEFKKLQKVKSETSEDEFKKLQKVKSEIFSDNELDNAFTSIEEKCHKRLKDEEKYVKKEKRNKHQEFTAEELNTQIFGESPVPEIKAEENFDSERMFGDMSSADDNHEMKKQKNELRKKHKKKQKRQKHSLTSEDDLKIDSTNEPTKDEIERLKNIEKKKQHSKKEKRRDKNKEDHKDKSRKSKKLKSEMNKMEVKRDGKMENIFGSFSDDSETGSKEPDRNDHSKNSFLSDFTNDKLDNFVSDSDSVVHIEKEIRKSEEKERLKEEHKKRKEKKRREKEKRIREEEFNENSVDYADLGKQLEANIKGDSNDVLEEIHTSSIKSEGDERCDDVFRFTEVEESQEIKVEQERKESKEKKKKRKKSKEEKHKHHHHHHDKNKIKSPEIKKELDLLQVDNIKEEVEKATVQSPSLPNLSDLPSSPKSELQEPVINSLPKTPTKEKKRDKLIPAFGSEIDEKVHETAIKSISEFEIVKSEVTEEVKEEELKPVKSEVNEDKPRVVISQEETEDAVAALLGESFGESEYASCYSDEQPIVTPNEQETNVPEVNIVEDLEEMRQAVQSLNSGDLDIKPDTPQSEHELQIDTDTDEPEETNIRFDQSPRTPDTIDLSQPPKTPDIPSYYRSDSQTKTVVIKATNLSSPPSLTPIKPPVLEVKKTTEVVVPKPVVTQSWSEPKPKPVVDLPKIESMPELKIDTCVPATTGIIKSVISPTPKPLNTTTPHITSCTIPIVKVTDHVALKPFSQPNKPNIELTAPLQTPTSLVQNVKPHVSQPYSLPVHMKFNNTSLSKPSNAIPISKPTVEPPKVSTPNVPFNRLPITPIMMSKPFQATTTALPQPKIAQTNDMSRINENKDQSRVTYSSPYLLTSQPRMIVENLQLQRGLPPQTVVQHIPTVGYRLPTYSNSSLPKEAPTEVPKVPSDYSKIVPTLFPYSLPSPITHPVHSVISDIKHPTVSMPDTSKSFMPVIQETPKLSTLSPLPSIIQSIQSTSKPVIASYNKPVSLIDSEIKPEPQSVTIEKREVTTPKVESPPVLELTKPDVAVIKATDQVNLFLKNEKVETVEEKIKVEPEEEKKVEKLEFTTIETTSVIKKTIDEDKGETESIESDISKERLSADLVIKDDGLDSKEDSDYWSAKEVNIDSVIRKVDALCSADELSDRSSEIGKDDWYDSEMKSTEPPQQKTSEPLPKPLEKPEEIVADNNKDKEIESAQEEDHLDDLEVNNRGGRRGGRNRGRKGRGGVIRSGVQTRHAKVKESVATPAKRGGRGGRPKNERKIPKPESDCADVYEFRDDADENNSNKDRPRLILTIKSPVQIPNNGTPAPPTAIKEVPKEAVSPKADNKEEFISPTNTRKSRRLQERDGTRNTVDDTIEDVVRNTPIVTRSTSAAVPNQQNQLRRSTRQNAAKAPTELTQKTTRGGAKKKDRRASETTDDSSEEKSVKTDEIVHQPVDVESSNVPKEIPTDKVVVENPVVPKEKPHQGLKAAVLRRVKGDLIHEPQTLIDPVTGLLMPMRECEEGRYIPIGGVGNPNAKLGNALIKPPPVQAQISPVSVEASLAAPNPPLVLQQQKLQSLKAHVLSSQAARVVVSQQPQQPQLPQQPQQPQKLMTVPPPATQPTLVMKSNIPINQHLNINVSSPNLAPTHLSPKPNSQPSLSKALPVLPGMKMSPPSPNHSFPHVKQTAKPQHIPQIKQSPTNVLKPHFAMQTGPQIINTQVAHAKQLPTNKGQVIKSHGLHPSSQILTGAVASPPLKPAHHNQQSAMGPNPRLMQGSASVPSSGAKGSMEPPKVEVSMPNCVMVPHPTSSPQGQPGRNMLQTGLPLPGYEANMHGDRSVYNRSRSPPPAHQHSPSPQGEALAHFPPGSVKLRSPHDILPAHYLHPQHVMYQQYLRQPYHLPRSPLISNNAEKTVDGQEGEEAPVELRRPGSVGLALTGRPLAVPHSLQSPHDRSTDSPQVGQVYNMHNSRLQHYHPGRYFDQAAEPPPAHRPMPSHGSYGERSLGHMALGTPDRPLSSHLPPDRPHTNHLPPERPLSNHMPPDRPLSNHMPPDRPLSSHSAVTSTHLSSLGAPDRAIPNHLTDRPLPSHTFTLGAGLGAAGNLMGAVARHVGAEAPASQRGLQAATPPHASQVPPQAESLLMLLKQYPCMWQGLLALKNDQAAVQMYFVSGNDQVAKCSLPKNTDGSTPPLRIFQRMRLEPPQVEGVARKMQMENEHCMLLALPCGHDHMDVLKQSTNLTSGFITYLQQKQAAGIVNVAAPGTTQPPAYVVHIFPSCDFVNENLRRIAPNLLERVSDIAHLLIVITTV